MKVMQRECEPLMKVTIINVKKKKNSYDVFLRDSKSQQTIINRMTRLPCSS